MANHLPSRNGHAAVRPLWSFPIVSYQLLLIAKLPCTVIPIHPSDLSLSSPCRDRMCSKRSELILRRRATPYSSVNLWRPRYLQLPCGAVNLRTPLLPAKEKPHPSISTTHCLSMSVLADTWLRYHQSPSDSAACCTSATLEVSR